MDFNIWQIDILILSVFILLKDSFQQSVTLTSPQNQAVLLGADVTFQCKVSQDDALVDYISWEECITNDNCARISNDGSVVYAALGGDTDRESRYMIKGNKENKEFDLKIVGVTPEDAGKYRCLSRNNAEVFMSAELIILEKEPQCSDNYTSERPTEGTILPIDVSCELKYHGIQAPVMEFKVKNDDEFEIKPGANHTTDGHMKYDILYSPDVSDGGKTFVMEMKFTPLPAGVKMADNVPTYNDELVYTHPRRLQIMKSKGTCIASVLMLVLLPLVVINL